MVILRFLRTEAGAKPDIKTRSRPQAGLTRRNHWGGVHEGESLCAAGHRGARHLQDALQSRNVTGKYDP